MSSDLTFKITTQPTQSKPSNSQVEYQFPSNNVIEKQYQASIFQIKKALNLESRDVNSLIKPWVKEMYEQIYFLPALEETNDLFIASMFTKRVKIACDFTLGWKKDRKLASCLDNDFFLLKLFFSSVLFEIHQLLGCVMVLHDDDVWTFGRQRLKLWCAENSRASFSIGANFVDGIPDHPAEKHSLYIKLNYFLMSMFYPTIHDEDGSFEKLLWGDDSIYHETICSKCRHHLLR